MFDNLLFQPAGDLLADDIRSDRLPGAILLSGSASSGKLTCALEIARILACRNNPRGEWTCVCPSCLQHKALVHTNVLLAGPRDCSLEIAAAQHTFLQASAEHASYANAARYLFVRSIRKLTMRFSQILWQDDDKLPKIAPVVSAIDECLEQVDYPRELPESEELAKLCGEAVKQSMKLEEDFMYDSVPVNQVRNASLWAHMSASEGKKVIILENADLMLDSVRNALLKILEEPPADTVFVLTTTRRGAVMPTILSRVRTYTFADRTPDEQKQVVSRVFHDDADTLGVQTINGYMQTFLPVSPEEIRKNARSFFAVIASSGIPDVMQTVKDCGGFGMRILLKIFLEELETSHRKLLETPAGTDAASQCVDAVRTCWNDVTIYNQTPAAALEQLVRMLLKINAEHAHIFKSVI